MKERKRLWSAMATTTIIAAILGIMGTAPANASTCGVPDGEPGTVWACWDSVPLVGGGSTSIEVFFNMQPANGSAAYVEAEFGVPGTLVYLDRASVRNPGGNYTSIGQKEEWPGGRFYRACAAYNNTRYCTEFAQAPRG